MGIHTLLTVNTLQVWEERGGIVLDTSEIVLHPKELLGEYLEWVRVNEGAEQVRRLMGYVGTNGKKKTDKALWDQGYCWGMLTVGLELETTARLLWAMEGTSLVALSSNEIAASYKSFLDAQGMREIVDEWYARLLDFKAEKAKGMKLTPIYVDYKDSGWPLSPGNVLDDGREVIVVLPARQRVRARRAAGLTRAARLGRQSEASSES